jgi:GTP 3',8-cyclase
MEIILILMDQYGRKIKKLRVSLTDKCNLRCHYCMPVNQTFMDESRYLGTEEILKVVSELQELGLEEVRLTGGEPLMRKSFPEIVTGLAKLNLKKLGLTTNGIYLDKYLEMLKASGVFHLNISLDSLSPENFKKITYGNFLPRVIANIRQAVKEGFIVKINAVMMKGINDHELFDFVQFAETEKVEVRFLELMRIGHALDGQNSQYIPSQELIKKLGVLKKIIVPLDSTSFNFLTQKGGRIGFIASESQPFCGHCSRWRLSADGILRACLLKDDGRSVRVTHRKEIYQELLGLKPMLRPKEVGHSMNAIGG